MLRVTCGCRASSANQELTLLAQVVAQMVEHLPSKCKILSSNSTTAKKKKKKADPVLDVFWTLRLVPSMDKTSLSRAEYGHLGSTKRMSKDNGLQ
jgi:hypothetical protein